MGGDLLGLDDDGGRGRPTGASCFDPGDPRREFPQAIGHEPI